MNWRHIATVYLKELKDSLRDRRALISIVVIPTLVMPGLTFGVGKIASGIVSKAKAEIPVVVVLGGDQAPALVAELQASKRIKLVPAGDDWKTQIADKRIRAALQIPPGFESALQSGDVPSATVYHYEGEMKSGFAAGELERILREFRQKTVAARLAERNLPAKLISPFEMKRENVAPPEKVGGNLLGGLVPYLIVILCFTGAMYPAMDLTAGEKERGTMETLLCSPVARLDLVLGKFLVVLTGSLSAMLLALASMGASAIAAGMMFGSRLGAKATAAVAAGNDGGMSMPTIDPAGLIGVVAIVFPVAVLFSALLLTVSLFAKTFKEAQSYTGPMIFVVIMPAVVGMLPGIDLNARLAMIPILNLSLVCKEMLSGVWHWNFIALIFGSSCVYAAVALAFAVRMFNRENVIFRA